MKKHIFANVGLRGVSGKAFPAGVSGAVMLALAVLSCDMPAEPSAETGYGKVRISLSNGRTAFPTDTFENYTYQFSTGGTPMSTQPSSDEGVYELPLGTYTVMVNAFVTENESDPSNAAATGEKDFTVTSGNPQTITVTLTGKTDSGQGTFRWNIEYPYGTVITGTEPPVPAFTLKKLPELTPEALTTPLSWQDISGVGNQSNVPAGFYLAEVTLYLSNGKKAGKTEVVHIYNKMTTDLSLRFATEDFIAQPLDGSVNIKVDGAIPKLAVKPGTTLAACISDSTGEITGNALSGYTYQWYSHTAKPSDPAVDQTGAPLSTGGTYRVRQADAGKYISVKAMRDGNSGFISSLDPDDPGSAGKRVVKSVSYAALFNTLSNLAGGGDADDPLQIELTGFPTETDTDTVTPQMLINKYAFIYLSYSEETTSVTLPANAFKGCKLTGIELPEEVSIIKANAFKNCSALETVICRSETPPTLRNINAFSGVLDTLKIYVPDTSVGDAGDEYSYKGANNWKDVKDSSDQSRIFPITSLP
jgi:hypothetical protein